MVSAEKEVDRVTKCHRCDEAEEGAIPLAVGPLSHNFPTCTSVQTPGNTAYSLSPDLQKGCRQMGQETEWDCQGINRGERKGDQVLSPRTLPHEGVGEKSWDQCRAL